MAALTINEEHELPGGWSFEAAVGPRAIRLRLSWQDYDLWGRGTVPPADVARAVIRVLERRSALEAARLVVRCVVGSEARQDSG